jgi:phage shock protein PspC (stress-responsive transcriptional regulator)
VGKTNPSVSNVVVINATGGEVITSGNYTLTSTTITGSETMTLLYNGTGVNVSYTTSFDSTGKISTEGVISDLSGGFGTFFGFSNTFFTIAAIVLLIFMLVGLLSIVMMIAKGSKKGGSGYEGY